MRSVRESARDRDAKFRGKMKKMKKYSNVNIIFSSCASSKNRKNKRLLRTNGETHPHGEVEVTFLITMNSKSEHSSQWWGRF